MLRVLLVDDETIVLESVSQVLLGHFENITIETAKNSREGLIKLEHFRPDVIMTDIKMPGMNGLEFIERIRKIDKNIKIVIVSAYDHFEYAKDAVKFGVEEYILKPLTKAKLIEVMTEISLKVDQEVAKRNRELDHIERYYQSIQLVEANFINSLLLNRNILKYMDHYREILEIPLEKGAVINIEFDKLSMGSDAGELSNYNKKLYDCADYLKTHIKFQRQAIVSNPFLNRIFVYVEGDMDRPFWNQIPELIVDRFKMRARVGVGSVRSIDNLRDSYSESLLALRIADDIVCSVQDIKLIEASYESFDSVASELYDAFIHRNRIFKAHMKKFEGEYIKLLGQKSSSEYAEAVLTELFVKIKEATNRMKTKDQVSSENTHYLIAFFGNTVLAKLQYFEKTATEWFSIYEKMQSKHFNEVTLKTIEFIKDHYADEVSLEDVATKLSVTPQYLSKLFKEETGINFKEYLTELRIEASKSLLIKGEMSIKDICFKVGYNDTSYFIRAFKKYEGLTPKDYQKIYR